MKMNNNNFNNQIIHFYILIKLGIKYLYKYKLILIIKN